MKLNFAANIPDHVPESMIGDYPLGAPRTFHENVYETLIPGIHAGPAAFMSRDAYLGVAPAWIFRRTEDMRTVFMNTVDFVKKGHTNFAQMIGEDWDVIPTELDPPRHTAIRKVLNPLFKPASVGKIELKVRARAQEFIAKFRDSAGCDLIKEFATPYPVSIFLDLLGLPQEGMEQFLQWEYDLIHTQDQAARAAGVIAVKAILMEAIDARRDRPTDDLISNALRLEVDGKRLSPLEVFGHCFNLYLGGLDTVSAIIGLQFMHLATRQDDQCRLRDEPGLIPRAMTELLRAYPSVATNRICVNDVQVAGVQIKAGDKVVLSTPLSGRDPEEYDAPGEIRFDRNASNTTFGFGIHRCLGVYLAQREILFALEEMLGAIPQFRLADGFAVPIRVGNVIQATQLELVWR